MVNVKRKFYYKQLAPRPYSSLWIWYATHSHYQESPDYFLPHGLGYTDGDVVDDDDDYEDDYFSNGDSYGPLDVYGGNGQDGSTDWLDSTLGSLDESMLDLSECLVQSIPVVNHSSQSTAASTDNQPTNSTESKVSRGKSRDNKRKKLISALKSNDSGESVDRLPKKIQAEVNLEPRVKSGELEESDMRILSVNDSHTIVVLKKTQTKLFSIINGDAKVTMIVGTIVCDGYTLEPEQSTHISTGFGTYQIIIEPSKFKSFPTEDHLSEILKSSTLEIPKSTGLEIITYLTNRDSSLSESVIISFQKWRWPALTALRLFIQPVSSFTHWLQVSFNDIKSPVFQWSAMLDRLVEVIKNKVESAASKPIERSKTRGPRIIMLGGTNSGKSSLTRHLSNRIISSVTNKSFIIDCDPGQSEFSPPGIINAIKVQDAILSPPFVNCLRFNKDLIVSSSVAGTGLQNNPDLYIMSVKYLWEQFLISLSEEDSTKPVIINTIGWVEGLGIHLMVDILHIFQPDFVIEIKRPPWTGKACFPFDCNPDQINQLNGWLVQNKAMTNPSANLVQGSDCPLQPYLNYDYIRISNHNCFKRISADARRNRVNNQLGYFCLLDEILFKNLPELNTISLNLENLYFHVQHEFVIDKHLIPHIINGSWVHLCSIVNPESDRQPTSDSKPTCSVPPGFTAADADPTLWESSNTLDTFNLKILPFLRENKCFGSAIVREIDLVGKKLLILTPEPPQRLAQINCIVRPQGIFVPDPLQLIKNDSASFDFDPKKV